VAAKTYQEQRASIDFPFVDLLSDGRTPFRYVPAMLITSTAQIALEAAADYGTTAYPSTFAPDCNAYDFLPSGGSSDPAGGTTTYANATSATEEGTAAVSIDATFTRGGAPELPRAFFAAAANQPSFADGRRCDAMDRRFDTALSEGASPVTARVRVRLNAVLGGGGGGDGDAREMVWTDVPGWQVDSAFLEEHLAPCESLQAQAHAEAQTQAQQAQGQALVCGSGVGGSGCGGGSAALAALRPSGASPEASLLASGLGGEEGGGGRGGGGAWFQALRGIWRGALKRALQRAL
jgi:hypothetical protein